MGHQDNIDTDGICAAYQSQLKYMFVFCNTLTNLFGWSIELVITYRAKRNVKWQ
jgi:hypothetical protein